MKPRQTNRHKTQTMVTKRKEAGKGLIRSLGLADINYYT